MKKKFCVTELSLRRVFWRGWSKNPCINFLKTCYNEGRAVLGQTSLSGGVVRARLLIVEDELDLLSLIQSRARHHEFECMTESTGAECIQKAVSFEPDVILLDLSLPQISGLELLTEIRHHAKLARVPVIVFTAFHAGDIVDEAMARGASAYFTKGARLEAVFSIIREHIPGFQPSMADHETPSLGL